MPILPFHNRTLPTALRTQAQICTFCMIYISCIFCIWEGCYCCEEPGAVKVRFSTTALTAVTSRQQPWELFQAVNSFTNMLYGYYLKDGVVISDWFLQCTVCTTDFKLSFMIVCSALEVYKVLLSFFYYLWFVALFSFWTFWKYMQGTFAIDIRLHFFHHFGLRSAPLLINITSTSGQDFKTRLLLL